MLSGFITLLFRFIEPVRLMDGLDWLIVGLVALNLLFISMLLAQRFVS